MDRKNSILIVDNQGGDLFRRLVATKSHSVPETITLEILEKTLKEISPDAVIFYLDHQKEKIKDILHAYAPRHPKTYWA